MTAELLSFFVVELRELRVSALLPGWLDLL